MQSLTIEERVTISLALQRHLRAAERFEAASNDFNEACQEIRRVLPAEARVIANIDHSHYLVTSDSDGNFDIERIDTL